MSETITLGFTNPDYENIHVLNRLGGTGDVFAAHKKGMDIDVVIKRTQVQYHDRIKQENESIILKSLKHQYLPRIYDVLYGQDGCIYTVMDYIKGENLEQYVLKNGPVTQKSAIAGRVNSARQSSIYIRKIAKNRLSFIVILSREM